MLSKRMINEGQMKCFQVVATGLSCMIVFWKIETYRYDVVDMETSFLIQTLKIYI